MRNRTWPVFLIGLGSLLALLFLPGIAALRKTQEVYDNIRAVQEAHQRTQASLREIERRIYMNSVLVRDLLLDSSPINSERYESEFHANRLAVQNEIGGLHASGPARDSVALSRLETQLHDYWKSVEPVFRWSPGERYQRATFFLREQQRPRRQNLLAVAEEIGGIANSAYREQLQQLNLSQAAFRKDIGRIVLVAFLIGIAVAIACIFRIATLEKHGAIAQTQLRHLSTQLMHAQEEERKAISRELHDEVGQMLTALRMELGSLERLREDPARFQDHIAEAKTVTEQSLRTVRDLAVGLRPSVLDLGLLPALQWQARHFGKRSGIPVTVRAEGEFQRLTEEHKTCVYRIVQETLTNCARHAEAHRADVLLRQDGDAIEVTVHDDGRGFDALASRQGGLGLLGIEERVRELGGVLRIDSEPGKGSTLTVRFTHAEKVPA